MHENPLGSLLKNGALLRILEAVNGLEAYVAEHAFAPDSEGNQITFDGLWLSGLCHAAAAGMPDDGRMPLSEKWQCPCPVAGGSPDLCSKAIGCQSPCT